MDNRPNENNNYLQKFDGIYNCLEEIKKDQTKQFDNIIAHLDKFNENIEMRMNEFNVYLMTLNNRVGSVENELVKINKKINMKNTAINNKHIVVTGGSSNNNSESNNNTNEIVSVLEDSKISQKLSDVSNKKPRINTYFQNKYLNPNSNYRQIYLLDDEEFYDKLQKDNNYINLLVIGNKHDLYKYEAKKVWAKLRGKDYKNDKENIRKDLEKDYS